MSNLSIETNASNDIFMDSSGNLSMATALLAVQQDCEHALKAQYGEMVLQPTGGMPTLADVWSNKNFIKWQAVAQAKLQSIAGVAKVISFVIGQGADNMNYTAVIQTVYSPQLVAIVGIITA
jgi:hypothetical protein